jgi:hypothetical protein
MAARFRLVKYDNLPMINVMGNSATNRVAPTNDARVENLCFYLVIHPVYQFSYNWGVGSTPKKRRGFSCRLNVTKIEWRFHGYIWVLYTMD